MVIHPLAARPSPNHETLTPYTIHYTTPPPSTVHQAVRATHCLLSLSPFPLQIPSRRPPPCLHSARGTHRSTHYAVRTPPCSPTAPATLHLARAECNPARTARQRHPHQCAAAPPHQGTADSHGCGGLDKNFMELWTNPWMYYILRC